MAKKTMLKWPADHVERRPVASLVPYARNSRTHSDEQVAQLAASITEWGWTVPVLIDEAGSIIAGHGRVLAAHKLGLSDIPVMVAAGWSDAKRRAYVLADNKLALNAGWDHELLKLELADLAADGSFDLTLLGFAPMELDSFFGEPVAEPEQQWQGMPEFVNEDLEPVHSLKVHFASMADFEDFKRLIAQDITEKRKFVWYPEQKYGVYRDREYAGSDG